MNLNENIVIVGPTLKEEKNPSKHLRVYYRGGRLADIYAGPSKNGKSTLMSKAYKEQFKDNIEKKEKFEKIVKDAVSNDDNLLEVLSDKEKFQLIKEAFEKKWTKVKDSQKERDVETQIMRNFMISENDWIAVDMEFKCPGSWFEKMDSDKEIEDMKENNEITDSPKFDIITISKEGIGIIELKVDNENCDNILSHYAHMKHILNNKESKTKFINEIHRRIDYLQKIELINSKIIDKYGDQIFNEEKLWCGFLFVGGGKSRSVKIVNELENKEFTNNLKFMYCDFNEIDSLNINNMQKYTEFTTITFEQIEQRLKNKPQEQWTKDDVFDRYVGYGSPEEIENPEVQKLFIKHGLFDELINIVNNVITDKEVVEKILNSNILKK